MESIFCNADDTRMLNKIYKCTKVEVSSRCAARWIGKESAVLVYLHREENIRKDRSPLFTIFEHDDNAVGIRRIRRLRGAIGCEIGLVIGHIYE